MSTHTAAFNRRRAARAEAAATEAAASAALAADPLVPGSRQAPTLAARLLTWRLERGLRQAAAARIAGVGVASWGRWENGSLPSLMGWTQLVAANMVERHEIASLVAATVAAASAEAEAAEAAAK